MISWEGLFRAKMSSYLYSKVLNLVWGMGTLACMVMEILDQENNTEVMRLRDGSETHRLHGWQSTFESMWGRTVSINRNNPRCRKGRNSIP